MGAQRRLGGVDEDHGSKVVGEASGGTGTGRRNPAARGQYHGHQPPEGESDAGGASAGGVRIGWIGAQVSNRLGNFFQRLGTHGAEPVWWQFGRNMVLGGRVKR